VKRGIVPSQKTMTNDLFIAYVVDNGPVTELEMLDRAPGLGLNGIRDILRFIRGNSKLARQRYFPIIYRGLDKDFQAVYEINSKPGGFNGLSRDEYCRGRGLPSRWEDRPKARARGLHR